jgi:hypothetical protein
VGDLLVDQPFGDLPDHPLRGHAKQLVRALLGGARADDLVDARILLEDPHHLGNALVRVAHVGVGPHDDVATRYLRADTAYGAGAAIALERLEAHVRVVSLRLRQHFQGVVGRRVVDPSGGGASVAGTGSEAGIPIIRISYGGAAS